MPVTDIAASREIVWIVQEKTKIVVAGVGIDKGNELVAHRADIAHAQKCIGSELALHRKIKVFRVRQAILVEESNFSISVEWFVGCKIKRLLRRCRYGNDVRKHLAAASSIAIIKRGFQELETIRIPKQAGWNVADLLELAQVLEGGVKNSRAHANASLPRPAS